MSGTVRLEQLIEKSHIKCRDFDGGRNMEAFGVSNTDGITRTAHRKSDDLGEYLVIEPGSFAYNPYRINVGSIGLTPEGLTGVVSPAYIVFRTKDKLIPEVLLDFLKSAEGLRQINKLASGAVRKALRFEDLCEIEFPALSHGRQLEILKHKKGFNQQHGRLLSEIAHQESLLAKLKQAILQEAIKGNLTAEWRAAHPDVEPASQLLHRIQAEKARLIASKKLRAEKPLPKIPPAEIPFEIPKGWEWCRLNNVVCFSNGDRSTNYPSGSELKESGVPFINSKSIHDGIVDLSHADVQYITEAKFASLSGGKFRPLDIVMVLRGSGRGKSGILFEDDSRVTGFINAQLIIIRGLVEFIPKFFRVYLESSFFFSQVDDVVGGAAQPHISGKSLQSVIIPLPPLAEQAAIVARVEALMTTCSALEAEIEHTRTHAAHLLQAVLKEAFSPASTNGLP